MCQCLNVTYNINGVYTHSLADSWKLVKVPKHRRKGLWLPVFESGKRFSSFFFRPYFRLSTEKKSTVILEICSISPYYWVTPIDGIAVDQLCTWCTAFLLARQIQALQTPTVHSYCCFCCYDLLNSLSKLCTSVMSTDSCASLRVRLNWPHVNTDLERKTNYFSLPVIVRNTL